MLNRIIHAFLRSLRGSDVTQMVIDALDEEEMADAALRRAEARARLDEIERTGK